jgi:hypothetical protein
LGAGEVAKENDIDWNEGGPGVCGAGLSAIFDSMITLEVTGSRDVENDTIEG